MMIIKLAWRNIWRSKRRTLISMSAVGLGLALVVLYGGLVARMLGEAKEQLDNTGLGHVEVTAPGWRANRGARLVVPAPQQLIGRLALPPGSEAGSRVVARGLLSSARSNEAVEVHGVDWQGEAALAGYLRRIVKGAVPEPDDARGVVIGDVLADKMKLEVGHKLRLMVQRADGEMSAELLRVRGVYHALSPQISQRRVLIDKAAAQQMLGIGDAAHEIVVQLPRAAEADGVAAAARAALGAEHEVKTYAEIYPVFQSMDALIGGVIVVMSLFVYFLVGLGILNTMLMSVLERTRELGVMQALGTRPSGIVKLILAESFWIATLSVVVGLTIGVGLSWLGSQGDVLDFSKQMGDGIELSGAVVSSSMRTEVDLPASLRAAAFVYLMALVVGIYPAWRITRLRPVEAIHST